MRLLKAATCSIDVKALREHSVAGFSIGLFLEPCFFLRRCRSNVTRGRV